MVVVRFHLFGPASKSAAPSGVASTPPVPKAVPKEVAQYHKEIRPILEKYCFDCHADGAKKGNLALDEFKDDAELLARKPLWLGVLKNVRAGVMPPPGKHRPDEAEQKLLADWIKHGAFGLDPANPDPGRVTIHRLNRVEYRHTVAQLLGVDYDTEDEFPPDAAGLGLDNLADLLSMSPLILEKYLKAAEVVLDRAMPSEKGREFTVEGGSFRGNGSSTGEKLNFYKSSEVVFAYRNTAPGLFRLKLEMEVSGDGSRTNLCHLVVGEQSGGDAEELLLERDFNGLNGKYEFTFDRKWSLDPHSFRVKLKPPPGLDLGKKKGQTLPDGPFVRITRLRITAEPTPESKRYFSKEVPPSNPGDLHEYIRQGVSAFGLRAFRRPLDERTVSVLSSEIEQRYQQTGLFVDSVKPSLAKMLCSPRFLFRVTRTLPARDNQNWALIDEYSLASRLSYFLWSDMPDDELLDLAAKGQLRASLDAQVGRMLAHPFSQRFIENFSGQWLQTRNVTNWTIVEKEVLKREGKTSPKPLLTDDIRHAMKDETTLYFARIVKEDRSILEIIDSDYTFLNKALADYYGIAGIDGREMRMVNLPADSPRGGVLTQGGVLMVTSGANRTSAVKRGVFVLDNILGMRPHDPPPDIPSIDKASAKIKDHEATFRESLELHRQDPVCASCHKLMDPIGFGLDNFNAMGLYRETEFGQPIDASGKLATGEEFVGVRGLKQILKTSRRQDFYRCLTEKLMAYALGRGLEYYDTEAVDQIVDRLEKENGRFSALLTGIIQSAPFQERRNTSSAGGVRLSQTATAKAPGESPPLSN